MNQPLRVHLNKVGPVALAAVAGSGGEIVIDGKEEIGGEGLGMRPMEALLTSLASCTAMDVMFILHKQKEPLERLSIEIEGERAEGVPSPFTKIHMRFVANSEVALNKFQRAVALSEGKYCSVKASLSSEIAITFEARLED